MKISNVFAIYFIAIAIGMFGAGGAVAVEISDGDKMVEFLFIILCLTALGVLVFYLKKLVKAEKDLKVLEN